MPGIGASSNDSTSNEAYLILRVVEASVEFLDDRCSQKNTRVTVTAALFRALSIVAK